MRTYSSCCGTIPVPVGFLVAHLGLRTSGRGCQARNESNHSEIRLSDNLKKLKTLHEFSQTVMSS